MREKQTLKPITIAVPKGRILKELRPIFAAINLIPEPAFDDEASRALTFATNHADVRLIRVRSFDVATFVAFGAAELGIAGSDVLAEFDYPDLYAPVDLQIGLCRLSIAAPYQALDAQAHLALLTNQSHVRVATKYPELTRAHFAQLGVQAECVKLNGAMELAPTLGLCQLIVDLVSSGQTLRDNGLVELAKIMDVSSRLIVNRVAFKTQTLRLLPWIDAFRERIKGALHAA
jgi:ATP phosphoribosyltransferase